MVKIVPFIALTLTFAMSFNFSMAKDFCESPGVTNDFFGLCSEGKWWKNFENPELYIRSIANFWNKDSEKVIKEFGWSNIESATATEEPFGFNLMATVDLFEDDVCRQRFLCEMDNYFKEHSGEYSDKDLKDLRRVDEYFHNCEDYDNRMLKCPPRLVQVYARMVPNRRDG